MHWSENGLRSMLTLVLVRYTEPVRYEDFIERLLRGGKIESCSQHNSSLQLNSTSNFKEKVVSNRPLKFRS